MSGLHNVVPGVHVKGEITRKDRIKHDNRAGDTMKNKDTAKQEGMGRNVGETVKVKAPQNTSKDSFSATENKQANKEKIVDIPKADRKTEQAVAKTEQASTSSVSCCETTTTATPTLTSTNPVYTPVDPSLTDATSNLSAMVRAKLSSGNILSPNSQPGSILNSIIRSTIGISSGFVSSTPITTTAKSSFVTMTTSTTSSSVSVAGFPRPRHVRSRSSENLLSLIAPFNQNVESTNKSSETNAPNLPAGGIGIGSLVGRLVRSPSNENLAGSLNGQPGFSRSASSGKLSDLLKNSDIGQNIGKVASFDTIPKSSSMDAQKRLASFHLGESPPSASQLEMMGDLGGFALMSGGGTSSPPGTSDSPRNEPPVLPAAGSTRSVFDALSGIGGFFRRPRSKSLDNLGPLPANLTATSPKQNSGRKAPVERSLERFDQVFGPG